MWYSIAAFGRTTCPRGPWKTKGEALQAYSRWYRRVTTNRTRGDATNLRLIGPYRTREAARQADVSDPDRIRGLTTKELATP